MSILYDKTNINFHSEVPKGECLQRKKNAKASVLNRDVPNRERERGMLVCGRAPYKTWPTLIRILTFVQLFVQPFVLFLSPSLLRQFLRGRRIADKERGRG